MTRAERTNMLGFKINNLFILLALVSATAASAQQPFDDHQNMMDQLGVKALRRGPNPNDQSTFNEATANPYKDTMPNALLMKDGTKVTSAKLWQKRRDEISEDFEREVYGRIPANVPRVTWEVTSTVPGISAGVRTITRNLIGHVDNSAYPALTVNIQASFTVPAGATKKLPIMIEFGFGGPGFGARPGTTPWTAQAIAHGWGYGTIVPTSFQPDNNKLQTGIIGLTNLGKPRKPDDWGALRAWQWGVSRMIDYFEQNPNSMVDAKKVGIEGLSRYGKAAVVTEAFEPRIAVGLIGSSGEGGVKLHRHIFGEALENLAGGEYYWMAGNIIKYGASDPPKTAADLLVDSHELIAMCAPRPCFISYGTVENGDAKWVDAHGSFMAGVLAGPVYKLLGKHDFGTPGDYLTDPMPPLKTLIGGELAWRQHEGGHDVTPNWPAFFEWVGNYIKSPEIPVSDPILAAMTPSQIATPRTDPASIQAHKDLLAKAKQGKIDLYFVGDSIARRWGASDPQYAELLANWKSNFFGWNAADFGWGADRIENILWRLENGELNNINPKVIVILAGTNNLSPFRQPDDQVNDIPRGVADIVKICRAKAPSATIILTGILPRNDNMRLIPTIKAISARLSNLADGTKVRFIDLFDKLADADGKLIEGMMNADKLHPTVKGYQVWADALKPMLMELLGPPALTDHAPPPTGVPGVAKPIR